MTSMFPAVILGSAAMLGMLGSANAAEMNITQFKLLESIRDGIESSDVCDYMDGCACPTAEWSTMENPCGWPGITCDNGTESRQVVGLSLNFCELTDVPTPTLGLTSLLTLDLSDNFLTDLPSGLDALPLERLYLSGNIMRVLPLVVFELGLEVLHAARNLLDDVPPEIGALSWTLDEINLAYNSLGNISDHFCECESIGVANFAHAGLTGPLPMCLGELDSLRHLDLSHNSVIFPVDDQDRSLPDLTNCTSLEWLDLSDNLLYQIPTWIAAGAPSSLRTLNLADNFISSVSVQALPEGLEDLVLDNNPIDVSQGGGMAVLLDALQSIKSTLRTFSINAVTNAHLPSANGYRWQLLGDCFAGPPDGPDEADFSCAFRIHAAEPSNGGLVLQLAVQDSDSSPPRVIHTLTDNSNGTYDGAVPLSAVPQQGYYSFVLLQSLQGHPTNEPDTIPSPVVVGQQVEGSPCRFRDCLQQLYFHARECNQHGPFATAAEPDGAVCTCRQGWVRVDGEGGGAGWQCEKSQQSPGNAQTDDEEVSGRQIVWLVTFLILALAAGTIAVVQTVRLRRLQSAGDNESYGERLRGSE